MSEVRDLCRKTYKEFIEAQNYPTELKRALRVHERVPVFIDNLAREFTDCKFKVSRVQIESAVADMTRIFVSGVLKQATEKTMSQIKIGMLKAEKARKAEMDLLADAVNKRGEMYEQTFQDEKGNETSRDSVDAERFI